MLILAGLVCLARADSPKLPGEWQRARTLYYQGIEGDEAAYHSADQLFARLYKQHSSAPLIQAYYGSLRLLEAAHTWALWKKNRLSREGIRLLDEAVATQPQDLEIRFVRAATTYHLPAFFHRKEQSREDFAYLARVAVSAARSGRLEPRLAAASLFFYGEFLDEAGCDDLAIANWQSAMAVAPGSPAAKGAREKLRGVEH